MTLQLALALLQFDLAHPGAEAFRNVCPVSQFTSPIMEVSDTDAAELDMDIPETIDDLPFIYWRDCIVAPLFDEDDDGKDNCMWAVLP